MEIMPTERPSIWFWVITLPCLLIALSVLVFGSWTLLNHFVLNPPQKQIMENTQHWIMANHPGEYMITITRISDPCCASTPYGVWFITNKTNEERVIWVDQYTLKPLGSDGNKDTIAAL